MRVLEIEDDAAADDAEAGVHHRGEDRHERAGGRDRDEDDQIEGAESCVSSGEVKGGMKDRLRWWLR